MKNAFQFVATASTKHYNKGGAPSNVDVNGNYPIQLTIVAGQCPSRATVMSGTIAESLGIEAGQTYILQANYRNTNEYGDNWGHIVLSKLSAADFIQLPALIKAFGQPQVVTDNVQTEVKSATNPLAVAVPTEEEVANAGY